MMAQPAARFAAARSDTQRAALLRLRLLPVLLALAVWGCATSDELRQLRGELRQLRDELHRTRQDAVQAETRVRELDLHTEVHSYLQRDPLLAENGHFPSLEQRIAQATRFFTFLLTSSEPARALYFQPGTTLRVEFVSGVLARDDVANRLEVFSRSESFSPLSQEENEQQSYVIADGESLLLQTREPGHASLPRSLGMGTSTSELLFRFLPARGPAYVHQAFVRIMLTEAPAETLERPTALPRIRRAGPAVLPGPVSAPSSAKAAPAAPGIAPTVEEPAEPPPASSSAEDDHIDHEEVEPLPPPDDVEPRQLEDLLR